jgi:hypothetical protein
MALPRRAMFTGMDSLTAATCITNAGTLRTASIEYGNQIRAQIEVRSRQFASRQSAVDLAKAVAAFHRKTGPIVDSLLESAAGLVREIRLALRVQDTTQFNRRWWQLALISLQSERELLEGTCGRIRIEAHRLARVHKIARTLWRREWEDQYVELLDRIDDVSETIGLGLNPETRAEIEALSRSVA